MNNNIIIALVVGLLVAGGGVYFYKNQDSSSTIDTKTPQSTSTSTSTTSTPTYAPVPAAVIHNISIQASSFNPSSITVRKGETIVWTNKDSAPHTVTGGDLKSSNLSQNQTYSFSYDKTGTFSYHCNLHPNMKGTVTVIN